MNKTIPMMAIIRNGSRNEAKIFKIQEFHYGLVTAKNMLCIAVSSPTRVKERRKLLAF